MADFCRQCSIKMFGKDFKDLAGITTQEDWDKTLAVWTLCEGCGPIQVDPEGQCVTPNCECAGPDHWVKPGPEGEQNG